MKFITSLLLLLITSVGMAQELDPAIPNTFTAGTPALAAEVNENFINLGTRAAQNTRLSQWNTVLASTNETNIHHMLGGIHIEQVATSDGSGVASTLCPVETFASSANCDCDSGGGTRNYGILFGCQLAGNGGVAGCFPDGFSYNPGLPAPIAAITLVCISAVRNDGTPIFPKAGPPLSAKADVDAMEFETAVNKARTAVSGYTNALQAR